MSRVAYHSYERYSSDDAENIKTLGGAIPSIISLQDFIKEDCKQPVYKDANIYYASIAPGLQLWELLYGSSYDLLTRDEVTALQLCIDQCPPLKDTSLEEAVIAGTLGPYPADQFLLNDKTDWSLLVRLHLKSEPKDPEAFIKELGFAFPRISFSLSFPACLETFDGGHGKHITSLIDSLSALNDLWPDFDGGDLPLALKEFSIKAGFPTTLEGNGDRKDDMTFKFALSKDRTCQVLCEPHMKLGNSDTLGDSKFYYHRIHFATRPPSELSGKVLVGHAGKHL